MTLESGSATLCTMFLEPVFTPNFRGAVLDMKWMLDTYVRRVDTSIEVARQRVKAVLGNYTVEVSLETILSTLAVWLSGNALASINVVALSQTRLVPGWVTVCGRVNHFGM